MREYSVTGILAPVDLTDQDMPALRHARFLAQRFGARLTLIYSDPIVYPVDYIGPSQTFYVTATPEHQAALRADVEAHGALVLEGMAYEIIIAVGQPIPAILSAAGRRKPDLIVIGSHLRHGWRRALLGSVSDGVVHGSPCPVLVVASGEEAPEASAPVINKIICPVNFTDVARDAVTVCQSFLRKFDARLTLIHVLEPGVVKTTRANEARIHSWIDSDLADRCSYMEVVTHGSAAERVLDCAEDFNADLLVLGAQHKTFRDATVIGTTAERLIRFASCPVLIVPRQTEPARREVEEEVAAGAAHR